MSKQLSLGRPTTICHQMRPGYNNVINPVILYLRANGLTAVNVDTLDTLLPQVRAPLLMAHLPFDVDIVKPEAVPDNVYVAKD